MRSTIRACGALGVLALLITGRAQGQGIPIPPAPGHREITSIDFRKDGGWRAKTRRIMAARGAMLSQGQLSAMNTPGIGQVLAGDLRIPVVFIEYADTLGDTSSVIGDTAKFHPVFFSATPQTDVPARPYSLKTYYEQLSNGHLTVDGQLFGWIKTPKTYLSVGNNCAAVFPPCTATQVHNGLGAMLRAALDSLNTAGHQVDWGQFDNDGPDGIPNSGDDDGIVDFVTFIHPALGGECGGAGGGQNGNRIWAHRWYMSSVSGSQYTTKTPRSGGGFIRIEDYTIQSARGGNGSCSPSGILPIGTLAHETGHTFGIPDLYCTTNGCASEGVGEWSLMGSGNYTMPYSPGSWDAWSLLSVGWIKVDSLTTSKTTTLGPIQTSDTALVAPIPGSQEYLLLENRAYLQSDTAQFNTSAGSHRKQPGLLIWHIDSGVVNAGMAGNLVNSGTPEGVRLLQADGFDQLHSGVNRGDQGDPYPGSTNNHALTYHTNPAALKNNGAGAGFVIDSIQFPVVTGPVSFRFRRAAPYRVTSTAAAKGGQITVNGVTDSTYEELFAIGDSIHISVADTQLVNSNRTKLAFASWSDGQARVHSLAFNGTPDTVTATVNASYLVGFTANGNGTIGTSGPTTGTFVGDGNALTLTATPNSGQTFTNWTGDTTTANAVLVLPMHRPYNVVANFSGAVAVTYPQATNAILGITPLTSPQATYLDSQGNNNGIYDLGDYLAYLKANAIVPSAAVMTRILGATAHPLTPAQER